MDERTEWTREGRRDRMDRMMVGGTDEWIEGRMEGGIGRRKERRMEGRVERKIEGFMEGTGWRDGCMDRDVRVIRSHTPRSRSRTPPYFADGSRGGGRDVGRVMEG